MRILQPEDMLNISRQPTNNRPDLLGLGQIAEYMVVKAMSATTAKAEKKAAYVSENERLSQERAARQKIVALGSSTSTWSCAG